MPLNKNITLPYAEFKAHAIRRLEHYEVTFTVEDKGSYRHITGYDQFGDPLGSNNEMILSRECFIEAFTKYIEAYMKDRNNDKL